MDFGALGGSWKSESKRTRNGLRTLHGEHGQGRFAAFGIGDVVKWSTVANSGDVRLEHQISARRSSLDDFYITDGIETVREPGTTVTVDFVSETSARSLDRPALPDSLAAEFAIYLEKYSQVSIYFRSKKLDPSTLQESREHYELEVPGVDTPISLEIIEWNRPVDRALYLCNLDGMALGEAKAGIQAPDFTFTAYLRWGGFSGHNFLLADLGAEPLASVVEAARTKLREHFRDQASKRRRAVIGDWIREGVYPYRKAPATPVERAEREAYEVVAYAASDSINGGDPASRKLSLRLLKEALESNPGGLHDVLRSVLDLPQDRLEEFASLLTPALHDWSACRDPGQTKVPRYQGKLGLLKSQSTR